MNSLTQGKGNGTSGTSDTNVVNTNPPGNVGESTSSTKKSKFSTMAKVALIAAGVFGHVINFALNAALFPLQIFRPIKVVREALNYGSNVSQGWIRSAFQEFDCDAPPFWKEMLFILSFQLTLAKEAAGQWKPAHEVATVNGNKLVLGRIPRKGDTAFESFAIKMVASFVQPFELNNDYAMGVQTVDNIKAHEGVDQKTYPTADFNMPSHEHLLCFVSDFLNPPDETAGSGNTYGHCKAGRARSSLNFLAAIVVAGLNSKNTITLASGNPMPNIPKLANLDKDNPGDVATVKSYVEALYLEMKIARPQIDLNEKHFKHLTEFLFNLQSDGKLPIQGNISAPQAFQKHADPSKNTYNQLTPELSTRRTSANNGQRKRNVEHTKNPTSREIKLDSAFSSIQVMDKISNNLWYYLTNLFRAVYPIDHYYRHGYIYSDCTFNLKALLTVFIGEEAGKMSYYVCLDELNSIGVSAYNRKRLNELRSKIINNSQEIAKCAGSGFVYSVILTCAIFTGHCFIIEQLPDGTFFIHQSNVNEYTMKANRLHMNDGKALTKVELFNFLDDIAKIVTAGKWNQDAVDAYQRCFNVDLSQHLNKTMVLPDETKPYVERVACLIFNEYKYIPSEMEQNLKNLIPEKGDSECSLERQIPSDGRIPENWNAPLLYAVLSHRVTALQRKRNIIDYLKTLKDMYLLSKGNKFNVKEANNQLFKVSLERRTHPMRYVWGVKGVSYYLHEESWCDKLPEVYRTIKTPEMPDDVNDFIKQVDEDYKKVVNYSLDTDTEIGTSLVQAIAHFGRKIFKNFEYRYIDDDEKVINCIIEKIGETGKKNEYDGIMLVKKLEDQCGNVLKDFPERYFYQNIKAHEKKWTELKKKYSKLQSWYQGVISMKAVGPLCLMPLDLR